MREAVIRRWIRARGRLPLVEVPEPGYYLLPLAKRAWAAPVSILWSTARDPLTGAEMDRSPVLIAWLCGLPTPTHAVWPYCARRPISKRQYRDRLSKWHWDATHDPEAPSQYLKEPIDLLDLPPVY